MTEKQRANFEFESVSAERAEAIMQCTATLPKHAVPIYLVLTGSHAYGLNTEDSDKDYRGVYIPGPQHFYGVTSQRGPYERKAPDIVMHSLARFVSLAMKCNPNIIEQLFIPRREQIDCAKPMINILRDKQLFLSRQARNTYTGYAIAQLRKLKAGGTRKLGAKRRALREKFGYDTKDAMHCMRLVIQGRTLLETGNLVVRVTPEQREMLLDIKAGKWPYDILVRRAEEGIRDIDRIAKDSPLPAEPWRDRIEYNLMATQSQFLIDRKVVKWGGND